MQKAVASIVVMFALLGCNEGPPTAPERVPATPARAWSPGGLRVATFLVVYDVDNLVEGNESMLVWTDLAAVAHVDLVTTANKYDFDFYSDEVAANRDYAAKKILLYGIVTGLDKDAHGSSYFSLESSIKGVKAHLSAASLGQAASTKKGARVALVCDSGARIDRAATLNNCLFVDQYLALAHISPKEQVQGFFAGKVALPAHEFILAVLGYAIGSSPSTPKACIADPSIGTCDIPRWKLAKPDKEQLTDSVRQVIGEVDTMRKNESRDYKQVSCKNPSHENPTVGLDSYDACVMLR
jgi:hypothetical protein